MSLLTGEGNESTCRRLCNSKQAGYEGSLEVGRGRQCKTQSVPDFGVNGNKCVTVAEPLTSHKMSSDLFTYSWPSACHLKLIQGKSALLAGSYPSAVTK